MGGSGGCQLPHDWRPQTEACRAELAEIIVFARVLALHKDAHGAYNYLPWQDDAGLFFSAEIELLCDQAVSLEDVMDDQENKPMDIGSNQVRSQIGSTKDGAEVVVFRTRYEKIGLSPKGCDAWKSRMKMKKKTSGNQADGFNHGDAGPWSTSNSKDASGGHNFLD
ncbi:hypothetical protein Z043_119629 [Scleropages formosus]|uniref:Uncharacterized protein n=1 Tax=Scleropages formosus TaxID=113540 RepID=A0A0P7TMD3_SCLFO|nr:hypothetical protein Z043_119629 [Scleropages formosus]